MIRTKVICNSKYLRKYVPSYLSSYVIIIILQDRTKEVRRSVVRSMRPRNENYLSTRLWCPRAETEVYLFCPGIPKWWAPSPCSWTRRPWIFFVNFFQSNSGEAGRGARLWLVSFFYADKSAPWSCDVSVSIHTIRARFSLSLQSVCFLLWPHTGNSFFSNTTSQHLHGSLRYEANSSGLPMRTLHSSLKSSGA